MIADLVLKDANVYRSAYSGISREWLVIRNGMLEALLPENEASSIDWDCELISMEGRTILPGLYDSHIHLLQYSRALNYVDCETRTLRECLDRVRNKAEATPPGDWILGHGWDDNRWERSGTLADLDQITKIHPVFLTSKSLHSAWVNKAALQIAGVDENSQTPPGGILTRDSNGMLTGILLETAQELVSVFIPSPGPKQSIQLVHTVQQKLWDFGIVGVHNFDRRASFRALQALRSRGELGIRVLQAIPLELLEHVDASGMSSNLGDDWLRTGAVKLFMDGALGPHTAALMDCYEQEESNRGVLLLSANELKEILVQALSAGFPLAVHAIGDRANAKVLDSLAWGNAFAPGMDQLTSEDPTKFMHRIEHAQLLLDEDFNRLSSLNTAASMQPLHATSDMHMAELNWGPRCQRAYAWRSLLDSGACLLFGSDAPVESPNPFLGIHAAVTRRRIDGSPGPEGWIPEQRITVEEAFHAYTAVPARFFKSLRLTGTLTPGSAADLIVMDHDLFSTAPHDIKDLSPAAVMVDGIWRKRTF